ncbi:hypothetical protein SLS60_002450 [Paraconiothyrium brasiliense]|uniref:Heterokaryon incompatibility domain-containing protein n=1 Tax=Paraconiothyrium brasiliense TaxID=300254 RepID=A0ABR3S256_9PLEO
MSRDALVALRCKPWVKAGWKIWVDALCINQQDVLERATQVKRMREIYTRAWTPLVWLGAASDGSEQVMDVLGAIAADEGIQDGVNALEKFVARRPEVFQRGIWRATYDFVARVYWTRVWVLQELSLGKANMPILYGDRTRRWDEVYRFFALLGTADDIWNQYIVEELAEVGRVIERDPHGMLDPSHKIWKHQKEVESGGRGLNLLQVMSLSREDDSTNPRDKVYGLLALMDRKVAAEIQVEYLSSVEQVYSHFIKVAIKVTKLLELLRHVAYVGSFELPCWVPDWTATTVMLPMTSMPYRASGDVVAEVTYPHPDILACRGFILDTLDGLGTVWRDEEEVWPRSTVRQTASQHNAYGTFEGMRDALWRTLVANRNSQGSILEEDYSVLLAAPALFKARHSLRNGEVKSIAHNFLMSWCAGFFAGNASLKLAGRQLTSYLVSDMDPDAVDSSVLRNALIARDRLNIRRRLFSTWKGYLGMVQHDALPTDVVCILYGCSMPMVLRPSEGGFLLVGECYLHGLMEGEAFELLRRQDTVERDFRLVGRNVDVPRTINHGNFAKGWKYTEEA